jgi:tRNA/rRNA methyltransferase
MAARARAGQACGVMFGQEKSGLGNDELALCDCIVTAPVNPAFASLNLAQAVLLVSYEWMRQCSRGSLGRKTEYDGPAREGLQMPHTRPATREELIGFFEQLESELDTSGFLWPPEKRPVMVRNLRNLFNRMGASEQEVRTLRGLVSSLVRRGRGGNHMP